MYYRQCQLLHSSLLIHQLHVPPVNTHMYIHILSAVTTRADTFPISHPPAKNYHISWKLKCSPRMLSLRAQQEARSASEPTIHTAQSHTQQLTRSRSWATASRAPRRIFPSPPRPARPPPSRQGGLPWDRTACSSGSSPGRTS